MRKIATLMIAGALLAIASAATIYALVREKNGGLQNKTAPYVLYYGSTCPHCKIVEDYIAQNNLAAKLDIAQKEVFGDTQNLEDMKQKALACKLDSTNLGVPMLWDGPSGRCYVGDQPIIDFFKQLMAR